MLELGYLLLPLMSLILTFLLLPIITKILTNSFFQVTKTISEPKFPKSYPIIGHLIAFIQHKGSKLQWLSTLINSSPSSTFVVHLPFGGQHIWTANPTVVEHVLKKNFTMYETGSYRKDILRDLLGDGIVNADGESWKVQRQLASHEFSSKSLQKYVETVLDSQITNRMIPILSEAAKSGSVLDLQEILQRSGFDSIMKITFGYDPEYLSPSLPPAKMITAFQDALMISCMRFRAFLPIVWKIRKFFRIGPETRLQEALREIHRFANSILEQKKQEMEKGSEETDDLLSRFLNVGNSDKKFVIDIILNLILAGQDTTPSALTWFFWVLHKNPRVEQEILNELKNRGKQSKKVEHSSSFQEAKHMVYTHGALCESMRLYPAVPYNTREAVANDTLPDGTPVKKGAKVTYCPYAMGRSEKLWGPHWAEYRPERWLEKTDEGEWKFVPRDPYSYPVFQAGPRVCLGKEMAFLQMKRVVAGVVSRFKVVPAMEEGFEPVYVPYLTAKMKGGFPVRIIERVETHSSK